MTTLNQPILGHKLIVPMHLIPLNAYDHFKVTLKNEDDEPVDYLFYAIDHANGVVHFDRGDLSLIYKLFGHLQILDQRSSPMMNSAQVQTSQGMGLTFTKTLKPNQEPVVNFLVNGDGYGQLKAHPRFGKTVVMTATTCILKRKTLFFSHQIDLANQVYDKFLNMTNMTELEEKVGRKVVGIVSKWQDLLDLDVAIMPYQKFVSGKGADDWLVRLRNQFGVLWVDESHKGKADRYSGIISSFNVRYRHGVSGTTELKKNKHLLNTPILGPVVVEGHGDQIPATVYTYETKKNVPLRPGKMFFTMMENLFAQDEGRNRFMLHYVLPWLQQGHSVILVSSRVRQIEWFTSEIRKAGFNAGEYHSKAFKNDSQREAYLEKVRSGEIQAMVAMRSMVLGLDVPRLTAFFNLMPTSHPQNYFQEICRVRTPFEIEGVYKKEMGYIIDFKDSNHILEGCYKTRRRVYDENGFTIYDNGV